MIRPREDVLKVLANANLSGDFDNRDEPWFQFEKHLVDINYYLRANMQVQKHWSLVLAAIYIVLVHLGMKVMEKRAKFQLRLPLLLWNLLMATWSMFIVVRVGPFCLRKILHSTFYGVICDAHFALESPQV